MLFEIGMGSAAYWLLLKLLAFDVATLCALLWARLQERRGVPARRLWSVVLGAAVGGLLIAELEPALVILPGYILLLILGVQSVSDAVSRRRHRQEIAR